MAMTPCKYIPKICLNYVTEHGWSLNLHLFVLDMSEVNASLD